MGRFKFLGHTSRTIRELFNEAKRCYRRTRFLKALFEIPAFKMRVHLGRIIEGDDSKASAPDWSVVDEDHFLETVPGGDVSGVVLCNRCLSYAGQGATMQSRSR